MSDGLMATLARVSELESRLQALGGGWELPGALTMALPPADGQADFAAAFAAAAEATRVAAPGALGPLGDRSASGADGLRFVAPVAGATVSQPFGPTSFELEPPATVDGVRYAHFHDGLDLAARMGTPVRAAAAGVVVAAGRGPDGAVLVRLRHPGGIETWYGHLAPELAVRPGDAVAVGETIGTIGLTGRTTGPHLHFELRSDGRAIDPVPWLQAGRLPGASADPTGEAALALARFDAVAERIPFAAEIRAAALRAGIDPLLLASLVRAESGFRPRAVSSAGAMGLTQLMPATARSLRVSDPFDPEQNLDGGARYLASDLRIFGRVDLALAAYQAGKGAVRAAGGIPPWPTTQAYVRRVLTYWSEYIAESGR